MLKGPGSIMFHKISFKPHPWPNGGWIVLGIDLGQSSGDFSGMWATGILLQDSFGESFGNLGIARAMTARSPQVLFQGPTCWMCLAARLIIGYSVCVCARVFGGIDKSIHSVTWFAWLWGRAAFLVPVFALAFSLRLEPSWAKQWWHSPYISLNCTRSNWVLSVLRQPGFLLGRQHGRFTTTWEIPSKYWKRSFQRSQVQQCCTWTLIGLAPLRKAWRKRFLWWRSWVSNLERDMFSLLWGVSCVL